MSEPQFVGGVIVGIDTIWRMVVTSTSSSPKKNNLRKLMWSATGMANQNVHTGHPSIRKWLVDLLLLKVSFNHPKNAHQQDCHLATFWQNETQIPSCMWPKTHPVTWLCCLCSHNQTEDLQNWIWWDWCTRWKIGDISITHLCINLFLIHFPTKISPPPQSTKSWKKRPKKKQKIQPSTHCSHRPPHHIHTAAIRVEPQLLIPKSLGKLEIFGHTKFGVLDAKNPWFRALQKELEMNFVVLELCNCCRLEYSLYEYMQF